MPVRYADLLGRDLVMLSERTLLVPVDGDEGANNLYTAAGRGHKLDPPQVPGIPKRYLLTFLGCLGFVNVYALRVNLSVALVDMVTLNETSAANSTSECPGNDTALLYYKQGEFDWSPQLQGIVLGSFFYGYVLTQIPGGWLAENYGGKKLFGLGVFATSALTLLTPVAARLHVGVLIFIRVLEGICEGVTFPAMIAMFGKWAPVWERSRLVAISTAGAQMGIVVSFLISGALCNSGALGGWPSVFYIFGGIGCVWFTVWMFLVSDTPSQHSTITAEERDYIESSIGATTKRQGTPWRAIFTSMPVYAIAVAHFSCNWGLYTMLTCLPSYLSEILHFRIQENGILSALPYFCCWVVMSLSGFLADFLRKRGHLTTLQTRKIFTLLGSVFPTVFMVAAGYAGCNATLDVAFLTIAVGLSGFQVSVFSVNLLDIAPSFAGTLMGLTNCFSAIPGFLGPIIAGHLTDEEQTQEQWRKVFFISAGIYMFGAIFYWIFASGDIQPWAAPETDVTIIVPSPKKVGQDRSIQNDPQYVESYPKSQNKTD